MKILVTAARAFIVVGVSLICLLVWKASQEKQSPSVASAVQAEQPPIAQRVVAMDRDMPPREGDIDVKRASYLLADIARRASTTELQVAKMTAEARRAGIDKFGRQWTMLELLETVHRSKDISKPEDVSIALAVVVVADGR